MYISKLEIFGFKSFAKKTNLKFGPGIAGIVGPNGCGKTNVVDAIRWVLGEQKTTVLRSDNMQEVIFNGSKSMKPLGMCEVSLTIHNNKGVLPVEYNDVVVTRRLYRDGQSEYLLNKQVCRLKDIQNLFIDTGMSSDAYSVIELKMVESILSDAKDERARMFEEAAGINKYKMERRSARRKLDATKEDLLRINDILYEIEKNVSSLRRQMRKYERYQRYESELRTKEIQLASHKLWELEGDIIPLEEQLERGKDFQSSSAEQIEIDEAIQTSLKEAIEEQSEKVEELNSELNRVDEALQESRRNILVWSEQRSAAEKSVERLNQEEINLENRKQQTRDQLEKLQSDLEQLKPRLNEAHQAYERQQEQYQQIDARYQSVRSKLDELQEEKIESITELADLRNKRERLLENRERAENEIAQERSRIENLGEELHEKEQNLEDIRAELQSLESGNVDREERIQQLRQKQDGLQTEIEQTREKLLKLESREDVIRSKIDFYQELIENREGFSAGVQYLTSEHQSVEGILGTVADVIQVDPDYELAV
ncbi:MAG: AAA family ATPase, partial [Candidatus Marinimicrobia bacterium]|nr:AAA family ATPase [Candidatus Neomarinimicrobiota bacterium]